jgi:hypothetical protein
MEKDQQLLRPKIKKEERKGEVCHLINVNMKYYTFHIFCVVHFSKKIQNIALRSGNEEGSANFGKGKGKWKK